MAQGWEQSWRPGKFHISESVCLDHGLALQRLTRLAGKHHLDATAMIGEFQP
jgi:hypothetical protein